MNNKTNTHALHDKGVEIVVDQLTNSGWSVYVPLNKNRSGFHLIVSKSGVTKNIMVNVKSEKSKWWSMMSSVTTKLGDNTYRVFVDVAGSKSDVYVLPNDLVADIVRIGHEKWLNSLNKNGEKHNDSQRRVFCMDDVKRFDIGLNGI